MFDLESCIAFLTNKTSKMMADAFNERLIPLGITRVQWIAMYYLLKYDGITQKDLGEKMDIKESTVARLIDRMEKDGLVNRTKESHDKRVTNLHLTESGKKFFESVMFEGEKMNRIFSKDITYEELEIFNKVLQKFNNNIIK